MRPTPIIVTRPNIAAPIIDKFGGDQAMAALTGHPASRINGWRRIGQIDDKYRPWLLVVAREHGISHTPWDYIAHLVEIPVSIAA